MPDPSRLLALLWRSTHAEGDPALAARRGRKQGLTVDAVIAAAMTVADAEGLDAVTMRRVAQELDVVPMTLYTYVPGKSELLEMMLDVAYQQMPRRDRFREPWRERLAGIAAENRALFDRHPWAAAISPSRPPLGPGLMAKYEHELRAFDGLGLDDVERDAALTYLLGFVQAAARAAAEARAVQRDSAPTDEQWWAANAELFSGIVDATRYPTAVRVGAAAGAALGGAFNPEHAYEFGLQRALDGLGVLIDRRSAP